ncbi:MAG: site-2 protease family protein [Synechococcus sp.]
MRGGLRLGSLFGIPLYINYTWFFIVGLLTLSYATNLTQENAEWTALSAAEIGLATSLGLFGSVLVHELAHSLVAKSLGISVKSITLFIFGGMATIEKEADRPWAAFKIAIAGPLLSFSLFAVLSGVQLAHWFPEDSGIGLWLSSVAWANLIIASFNLIPGLPLDGGQILKALIWAKTGSRQSGLKWAARSGQFLGWGAIAWGLWLTFLYGIFTGMWIGLIGLFILNSARRYSQYLQLVQVLSSLTAKDVMGRKFRVVDAEMSLREFADRYLLLADDREVYFADRDGRYQGLVEQDRMRAIERSLWDSESLTAIVTPMDQLTGVTEDSVIPKAIDILKQDRVQWIPVFSPTGAVSGTIDKGDVVKSLGERLGINIPPDLLQKVRETNEFPAGFPIDLDPEISE